MAEITDGGAVPFALPSSSGEVPNTGPGSYLGFTVKESSVGGAVAAITLYDNTSAANGAILEEITLGSGESTSDNYPRPGRRVSKGIFAKITGTIEGTCFQ